MAFVSRGPPRRVFQGRAIGLAALATHSAAGDRAGGRDMRPEISPARAFFPDGSATDAPEGRKTRLAPVSRSRRKVIEAPACAHCQLPARLVLGEEAYPGRHDLAFDRFWLCRPCGALCGATKTGKPIGRPGNKALREARSRLHAERFDPIIRKGIERYAGAPLPPGMVPALVRRRTLIYLAHLMGIEPEECSIAQFDLEQCRTAWAALRGVTYEAAREFVKASEHDAAPEANP